MKIIILSLLVSLNLYAESIYEFELESKKDKISLSSFKGKSILLTNIATKCGYTPQLEQLEKISKDYKDQLVVIGIPSNDYGSQTPEDDEGVAKFCKLKYGVSFPLTKKMIVKGEDKHKVITYLLEKSNKKQINWNFEKFLISPDGKSVKHFASNIKPGSEEILKELKKKE